MIFDIVMYLSLGLIVCFFLIGLGEETREPQLRQVVFYNIEEDELFVLNEDYGPSRYDTSIFYVGEL